MWFPYVNADPEPELSSRSGVSAGSEGAAGGRIVIAEDEDGVRTVAARALERQGFAVLAASSGDEALVAIEEAGGTVDLLITDVVMPGRSGTALAETVTRILDDIRD